MKIKVYQLLNRYSDKKILKRLFEKYPDQGGSSVGYEKVLEKLRKTEPKATDNLVRCQKYGCDFIKPGDETKWGFGIIDWGEVLGSDVNYANIDFICNLLWELTFYGFSEEEHNEKMKKIFSRVPEIYREKK